MSRTTSFKLVLLAAFLTQTVNLDDNTAVKFEIWDTVRYKSLAPIYFRNSNAAVIVYDITQTSFEKAKTWVRELQRQADPGIVIMLVGNKLDLSASRKTSTELGKQFADEEGLLFAEASAKSGEGVEGLFMEIVQILIVTARKLPANPPPTRTPASRQGVRVEGQAEETPSACNC
ncbi:GTP-binding protein YPT51 [Saitozyma sp. JCM 24511]|nr:GTP-binding protein YPT51 [Saitozyma sp. JCM 24511]